MSRCNMLRLQLEILYKGWSWGKSILCPIFLISLYCYTYVYTWQICQKHSTASNARNQKGYHLQNELAPLSTESNSLAMTSSTTWLHYVLEDYTPICNMLDLSNMPKLLKLCYNFKKSTSPDLTWYEKFMLFFPLFMLWQFVPISCQHELPMHKSALSPFRA